MSSTRRLSKPALVFLLAVAAGGSQAQAGAEAPPLAPAAPAFDAALARTLGADANGMRPYVLVVLKTGPTKVPAGAARDAMFKGHFANMARLAKEGRLAVAGPLDGVDGWRGLFVLAVAEIEEARRIVATDPVVAQGEMVAEYHQFYGSAGLMLVNDTHLRITQKP